jgi:hypothetical protein
MPKFDPAVCQRTERAPSQIDYKAPIAASLTNFEAARFDWRNQDESGKYEVRKPSIS